MNRRRPNSYKDKLLARQAVRGLKNNHLHPHVDAYSTPQYILHYAKRYQSFS